MYCIPVFTAYPFPPFLEYVTPIILLFGFSLIILFIISNVLSFEPSFTIIISYDIFNVFKYLIVSFKGISNLSFSLYAGNTNERYILSIGFSEFKGIES